MSKCQCPVAGWCETHKRKMSEVRHQQCQDDPGYFEAFQKSRGVGDTLAKITAATGVADLVKALAGDDCGCPERQEKLNEWFPY